MTEFTSSWPEEIFLYGDMDRPYQEQIVPLGWSEDNFNANVKYVRADLLEEALQELETMRALK